MDLCHFSSLPSEIAVKIIEKLGMKDRKNLALTCRKCYEFMFAVPHSKKLEIRIPLFYMNTKRSSTASFHYNSQLKCTLVKKVFCTWLFINFPKHKDAQDSNVEEQINFIVKNQSIIQIDILVLKLSIFEDVLFLLDPLVAIASRIDICSDEHYHRRERLEEKRTKDKEIFFTKHCAMLIIQVFTRIVTQWYDGQLPKLENCVCEMPHIKDHIHEMYKKVKVVLQEYVDKSENDYILREHILGMYLKNIHQAEREIAYIRGHVCQLLFSDLLTFDPHRL